METYRMFGRKESVYIKPGALPSMLDSSLSVHSGRMKEMQVV